jgi:hypothetical protein
MAAICVTGASGKAGGSGRPRSPRCTVDRCTPMLAATSVTSAPPSTARTASRRCSTTNKTTSANPGLPEAQTPAETGCRGMPRDAECRVS